MRTGRGPGPRPIDIDLLLYGSLRVECPFLTVPHPRMHEARLRPCPLADIAPTCAHRAMGGPSWNCSTP